MSMLEVRGLSYIYAGDDPLMVSLPSLSLERGQTAALTGVSGSGKSTLLECLGLIRQGFEAECLMLDGRSLMTADERLATDLRAALLGFMPQQSALIPFLKIRENLELGLKLASRARARLGLSTEGRGSLMDAGMAMLERLGIADCSERLPSALSIGQRQRAAFVRSLVHRPSLLLIDEPTSALDPEHGRDLIAVMLECVGESSSCALVITHDLRVCEEFALPRWSYDPARSSSKESVFTRMEAS